MGLVATIHDASVYSGGSDGIVTRLAGKAHFRKDNFAAVAAPTVNDDSLAGYEVGSMWYFGTRVFTCTDPSAGVAVWSEVNASGGGTPAGSGTELQYRNGSAFGAVAGSSWNGTTLALASPVTITSTSTQFTVRYDASNYYTTTVGATGTVTFDAVGTDAGFVFSKPIYLPTTTASNLGVIYKDSNAWLHDFHHPTGSTAIPEGYNFFAGLAGNFTTGSTATSTTNASKLVGIGYQALMSNTTGSRNVAIGHQALEDNTTGSDNVALGNVAGANLTTGGHNVAIGSEALMACSTGVRNFALGYRALRNCTVSDNVAIGYQTLYALQTGTFNVAIGMNAMTSNVSGSSNTCIGHEAGQTLKGRQNVAIGQEAIKSSGTGDADGNVAIGYRAGYAVTTGADKNVLLGFQAGDIITTGSNNIIIGSDIDPSGAAVSNELNIGNVIKSTAVGTLGLTFTGADAAFSGHVTLGDAKNIVVNTTVGSQIATAANQKLGFFGKAPRVQCAKASFNNWAAFGDVVDALVSLGLFDAA